jgi:tetratricopeptide (TPR) repeat protein
MSIADFWMTRMKSRSLVPPVSCSRAMATLVIVFAVGSPSDPQSSPGRQQIPANQNQASQSAGRDANLSTQEQAEEELRKGTALTRQGSFTDAIPHLLAAREGVGNEYAVNFDLALCYVGTDQFKEAIRVLNDLRSAGHDGADLENLLAQAYIGNQQSQEALASLQKAAALSPQNEKLYSFVADACMDHNNYTLGIKVVDLGLRNLPQSARLHYERAMFLTQLDELDQAKPDFQSAGKLAAGSEIGYLAAAHEKLFEGDIPEAMRIAREGVEKGYENHALLTVLGEALLRSGVSPGQPEFAEAQADLEKAVAQLPNEPTAHIALGSLYLMAGRLEDAITHLEKARHFDPSKPSVYANLARAYQRHGDTQQAQDALVALQKLNREQAERISSAPGDRKLGYAGRALPEEEPATPHP